MEEKKKNAPPPGSIYVVIMKQSANAVKLYKEQTIVPQAVGDFYYNKIYIKDSKIEIGVINNPEPDNGLIGRGYFHSDYLNRIVEHETQKTTAKKKKSTRPSQSAANQLLPQKGTTANQKKSYTTVKPKGKWRTVETYVSSSFDASGPFYPIPLLKENIFEITFKGNTYCDSRLKDVVDDTKVFCEPITVKADGILTGSRLEAFAGYMKLNGSKLEFYEGGKGFMKFVLEKSK